MPATLPDAMKHLDLTVTPSARRQLQLMLDTTMDSGDIVSVLLGWKSEQRENVIGLHVLSSMDADGVRTEAALADDSKLFLCDEFTLHIPIDVEPFIGRELIYAHGAFAFRLH